MFFNRDRLPLFQLELIDCQKVVCSQTQVISTYKGPLHIDIVLCIKQIKQLLKYEPLNVELRSMLMIPSKSIYLKVK
jgi:hypothetical protein